MDYTEYLNLTQKWLLTPKENKKEFVRYNEESYYFDEVGYVKKNASSLLEIAKKEGYKKSEELPLGLLQRRIRFLLESLLNSYDYGLDGRDTTKDEFFKKEHQKLFMQ